MVDSYTSMGVIQRFCTHYGDFILIRLTRIVIWYGQVAKHSKSEWPQLRLLSDTKNSIGVNPNATEEIAYNAVVVRWNTKDSPVKVGILVVQLNPLIKNSSGPWKYFPYNPGVSYKRKVNKFLVKIVELKSVPYNRKFFYKRVPYTDLTVFVSALHSFITYSCTCTFSCQCRNILFHWTIDAPILLTTQLVNTFSGNKEETRNSSNSNHQTF